MGQILEIATIFLTSSVKFLLSPFIAAGLGYGFLATFFITTAGGISGTIFFYLLSSGLLKLAQNRAQKKNERRRERGLAPRKVFTRRNKLVVFIKKRFGIVGLALVTPPLVSIPIGSILAARYFGNKRKTLPLLLLSVVFWSLILTSISVLF